MPYLETAILVPMNFVDKARALPNNYHFKHFDAFTSFEQITRFETKKCYPQKWQNDDIIFLQIMSDYTPIRVQVRNAKGLIVLSHVASTVSVIGSKIYSQDQVALDDTDIFKEGGYYILEIVGGDPIQKVLQSEVFQVREKWPGTLLFKYSNNFNGLEVLWETGIYFTLRLEGVIPFDSTDSINTVYIDQTGRAVVVKGDAFRNFKLYVGCAGGIPPVYQDKLEEITIQNNLDIDGKPFARAPGQKWSTKKIDRYPYAQWNIDMREALNRRAKRFESDGLQQKKFVEEFIVEGKLFGPIKGAANDNTYTINTIS